MSGVCFSLLSLVLLCTAVDARRLGASPSVAAPAAPAPAAPADDAKKFVEELYSKLDVKSKARTQAFMNEQKITDEQLMKLYNALPDFDGSKGPWYHWSNYEQCLRWQLQGGYVGEGEMYAITEPSAEATKAVAGAGMYLTPSLSSSAEFGPCLTNFILPAKMKLWDASKLKQVFGPSKSFDKAGKKMLGTLIPFIDYYNTNSQWYVVHHVQLVKKLELVPEHTFNRMRGRMLVDFILQFDTTMQHWEVKKSGDKYYGLWEQNWGYYFSFWNLMAYLDPISLVRAVKKLTNDPWQAFEPTKFKSFERARVKFIKRVASPNDEDRKPVPLGICGVVNSISRTGASSKTAQEWSTKMLRDVISQFPTEYSGGEKQFGYRTSPIRAGGDEQKDSFQAVGYQIENMIRNNLLTVMFEPGTVPGDYFAAYYYVDPDHISAQFNNLPWAKWAADANKEADKKTAWSTFFEKVSNEVLQKNLYNVGPGNPSAYSNSYSGKAEPWAAQFVKDSGVVMTLQRLISVHPFANYNGRSVRTFATLMALECGLPVPYVFNGDYDTLESPEVFAQVVDESTRTMEAIQKDMLKMMFAAQKEGRKAELASDYIKLNWFSLFAGMKPVCDVGNWFTTATAEKLEQVYQYIDKRQWRSLQDTICGTPWTTTRKKTVATTMKSQGELTPDPDRRKL